MIEVVIKAPEMPLSAQRKPSLTSNQRGQEGMPGGGDVCFILNK